MLLRLLEGEEGDNSVQNDPPAENTTPEGGDQQPPAADQTNLEGTSNDPPAENSQDQTPKEENQAEKKDETTNLQDGSENAPKENDNAESTDPPKEDKPDDKDRIKIEIGPNDDILQGKGMFEKYASVDELKADWEIIEESEYDISLDADQKTVSLKKKNEPSASSQYYDDGIMIQFEQQKPEHVSFYCKTDSQDLESCNFRLFRQGNKEAMGSQWNDKRKIN